MPKKKDPRLVAREAMTFLISPMNRVHLEYLTKVYELSKSRILRELIDDETDRCRKAGGQPWHVEGVCQCCGSKK